MGEAELSEFVTAVERALVAELPGAVDLRRRLHQIPEVAWAERETSAAIAVALSSLPAEPVAGTGLIFRVGDSGLPAVGLRAELDGLPIVEQTGAIFASPNGAMHACGHDVHMSALVALVRAFAAVSAERRPPASLLALFQPSEEAYPAGAAEILDSGRLAEIGPTAMLAVHVHPRVAWGAVTTGAGAVNACADAFLLTVTGHGGHGAYPHHGHDTVLALAQVIVALQQIVSRRTDPMHPTVVSVGRLEAGSAANVIPGQAVAEGTIRVLHPEDRDEVLGLVRSIPEHIAAGFGCEARVEIKQGDPALINDAGLVGAVDPWLERSGFSVAEPMRSCGADDFAFYSQIAPSLMMFLGVRGAGSGAGRDPEPGLAPPGVPAAGGRGAPGGARAAGRLRRRRRAGAGRVVAGLVGVLVLTGREGLGG